MADPFTTFAQVQNALETFVKDNDVPIAGAPHRNFWEHGDTEDEKYDHFVNGDAISGYKILEKGDGKISNVILALKGDPPFDDTDFPRMPAGGPPYLDDDTISSIEAWIDNGANQ